MQYEITFEENHLRYIKKNLKVLKNFVEVADKSQHIQQAKTMLTTIVSNIFCTSHFSAAFRQD